MQVLPVYATNNPSFKKLIIKNDIDCTENQKDLIDKLKISMNKIYSNDKLQRSHIDYWEEEFGQDILIVPNKNKDSVDLYALNNSNKNTSKYIYWGPISKDIEINDNIWLDYSNKLKRTKDGWDNLEKSITRSLIIMLVGVIGIAATLLLGGKKIQTKNIEQPKEIVTTIYKDSLSNTGKDSLKIKNFLK